MDAENETRQFIYQRLKELILKHKMDGASTLARAIKVLFPKDGELSICDCIFSASLDRSRNKATRSIIREFNYLINECYRYNVLFSPRGAEFYRLGRWSYKKCPSKAKQYLSLYLCSQEEYCGEAHKVRWRKQTEKLLRKLRHKSS